jgi:hypothetical protein
LGIIGKILKNKKLVVIFIRCKGMGVGFIKIEHALSSTSKGLYFGKAHLLELYLTHNPIGIIESTIKMNMYIPITRTFLLKWGSSKIELAKFGYL